MTHSLTVAYAGTPVFAEVALRQIVDAGFSVPLVLTQPDRPAGRGMKLTASPVKQTALSLGIPVAQPVSLRKGDDAEAAIDALSTANRGQPVDVLVVAAYGLILPQRVLDIPRLGCLNIHGSLLPRWRGAAPIHRAIEAGDAETGVCIMQMEAGLDTGPVRLREAVPIGEHTTTGQLHDTLAELGGRLIVSALNALEGEGLPMEPQPDEGVTYAEKISKAEALVDWSAPAQAIQRRIRAFDPFPGAHSLWQGEALKLFDPVLLPWPGQAQAPGTVLDLGPDGLVVQCGQGAVRVGSLQKPGARRGPAAVVAQSLGLVAGNLLGH